MGPPEPAPFVERLLRGERVPPDKWAAGDERSERVTSGQRAAGRKGAAASEGVASERPRAGRERVARDDGHVRGERVVLRVRLATPAQIAGEWTCRFLIDVDDREVRVGDVHGVDALQALWLAMAIVDVELEQVIAAESIVIDERWRAEFRAARDSIERGAP